MPRIVVGVDGSAGADTALAWAVDAARATGAALTAVHAWQLSVLGTTQGFAVSEHEVLEQAARDVLDESVDRADTTGLAGPIERVVVPASAAGALIAQAKDADLAVVGSRGRGGFAGLMLGSVSHQLVQHAPCPVVVVPGGWSVGPTRRIVVGVDGSDGARAALRWAFDWAGPDTEIDVVLAFDSDVAWVDIGTDHEQAWRKQATDQARAELRNMVDDLAGATAARAVHQVAEEGAPADVVLDRAEEADLLVVGTRGRGGFAGLLLGSVSQRCVERAPCPVAVIPLTA